MFTQITLINSGSSRQIIAPEVGVLNPKLNSESVVFFSGAGDTPAGLYFQNLDLSWQLIMPATDFQSPSPTLEFYLYLNSAGTAIPSNAVAYRNGSPETITSIPSGNDIWLVVLSGQSLSEDPLIWVAEADSTFAFSNTQAVAYDSNGNVFSLMFQGPKNESNSVSSIAKFSPEGTIVWTRDLTANTSVNPWSLVTDYQNNIYIIIQTENNAGNWNNTIVKMSGVDGSILWQYDLQDSQSDNNMQALAVFSENFNGVAVIGTAYNGSDNDFFLGFINTDGTDYSVTNLGDSWNQSAYGAATNPNGDIVITGITNTSGPVYMEVVKFSNGDIEWQNSYTVDENYDLSGTDVVYTNDGNWVVVSTHNLNSTQGIITTKLSDTDGSVIWSHEITNGCTNVSSSIATDDNGIVYISGSTYSGQQQTNGAPGLYRIVGAYNPDGSILWQKYFRGLDNQWVVDNNWWNGQGSTGKVLAVHNDNVVIGAISATWVGGDITEQVGVVSQFPTLGLDQSIGSYELRQSFLTDSPISLEVNGSSFDFNESSITLVASTIVTSLASSLSYSVVHSGSTLNKLINGAKSVILGVDGQTNFPGDLVDPAGSLRSIPRKKVVFDEEYTLSAADNGQFLYGEETWVRIPNESDTPLPNGFTVTIITNEDNIIYVNPIDSSTTRLLVPGLDYASGGYDIPAKSMATLIKVDTNIWYLSGYGVVID